MAPNISGERVVVVGFDRGYRDGRTTHGRPKHDLAAIRAAVQQAWSGETTEGSGLAMASDACTG